MKCTSAKVDDGAWAPPCKACGGSVEQEGRTEAGGAGFDGVDSRNVPVGGQVIRNTVTNMAQSTGTGWALGSRPSGVW